jgi:hypothetical protein
VAAKNIMSREKELFKEIEKLTKPIAGLEKLEVETSSAIPSNIPTDPGMGASTILNCALR